jgi:hypothetical protein
MSTRYGKKLGANSQAKVMAQFVTLLVKMLDHREALKTNVTRKQNGAIIICTDSSKHVNAICIDSSTPFTNHLDNKPRLQVEMTVEGGYYSQFAEVAANAAGAIRKKFQDIVFNLDIADVDEIETKGR